MSSRFNLRVWLSLRPHGTYQFSFQPYVWSVFFWSVFLYFESRYCIPGRCARKLDNCGPYGLTSRSSVTHRRFSTKRHAPRAQRSARRWSNLASLSAHESSSFHSAHPWEVGFPLPRFFFFIAPYGYLVLSIHAWSPWSAYTTETRRKEYEIWSVVEASMDNSELSSKLERLRYGWRSQIWSYLRFLVYYWLEMAIKKSLKRFLLRYSFSRTHTWLLRCTII